MLAHNSGVDIAVIEAFERRLGDPASDDRRKLARALIDGGALFIVENGGGEAWASG